MMSFFEKLTGLAVAMGREWDAAAHDQEVTR